MAKRFHKHKIENLIVVPKIVTVHYLELDAHFSYAGESHDFWELVYADKEDVLITAGSSEFVLRCGEIVFHAPNEFHRLSSYRHKAPNVFIITFECRSEAMDYFTGKCLPLPKDLKFHIQTIIREAKGTFDMRKQNPFITKLTLGAAPALGGQQLIRLSLEQLLIYLLRGQTQGAEKLFIPQEDFGDSIACELIKQLKEALYSDFSIDAFCQSTNLSRTKLYAVFRQSSGFGIVAYYTLLKIDEAKRLIRETAQSFSEISDRLGFASSSYFCKSFKKHTGMTPSQFKNSLSF